MKRERRRADATHAETIPTRLVIISVAALGILSLGAASLLALTGREYAVMLTLTNGCAMGLMGLLKNTTPPASTPIAPVEVTGPAGEPVEVTEAPVEATPNEGEPTDIAPTKTKKRTA